MSPPMIERVVALETGFKHLREDLDEKHTQNRKDIHNLRGSVEKVNNSIWLIKVKLATWSAVGGVLTAIVLKVLDHIWK